MTNSKPWTAKDAIRRRAGVRAEWYATWAVQARKEGNRSLALKYERAAARNAAIAAAAAAAAA